MYRIFSTLSLVSAVVVGFAVFRPAAAQSAVETGRPSLAVLTSMSAEEQTRLALSTAPPDVTARASLYVLAAGGYKQVRAGTNGFSCLVERELLETIEPVCYDAEGSATTLKARLYREELRAKGLSEDEVKRRIEAAYRDGRLRAPSKPGLIYMLAPEQLTWDPYTKKIVAAPPHLHFYAPYATQDDVGGFAGRHMPMVLWPGQPDANIVMMVKEAGR
ncbi:MAG TPA: hypothetical protein VFU01_10875 [Gemmatimonadaceae bacterium]|nr:hypothetical protein [Gemmatimonadaceae bacterium]